MIEEDYVSFKVAKLLKEKWFKFLEDPDKIAQAYIHAYTKEGKEVWGCYDPEYCPCITLNMACKWLRVVHNLYIEPMVIKNYDKKKLEYTYTIQDLNFLGSDDGIDTCKNWDTPEEAVGEAIKYCLKHLI